MNPDSLPTWIAISVILALMVGAAAGALVRKDGATSARALLTGGAWVGGCLMVAFGAFTLLLL